MITFFPANSKAGSSLAAMILMTLLSSLSSTSAWASRRCESAHIAQPQFSAERLERDEFKLEDFPILPYDSISEMKPLLTYGHVWRGRFNGNPVFIKLVQPGKGLKEAGWLQELNKLGLGPDFYGVIRQDGDMWGDLMIVTKDVGGVNTNTPGLAPKDFRLTDQMVDEMERQFQVLFERDVYPGDLQFQLGFDGKTVTLIDPEYFSIQRESKSRFREVMGGLLYVWQAIGRDQTLGTPAAPEASQLPKAVEARRARSLVD